MKLRLDEMKEIAKRLPIGYYLGRKVPVEVVNGYEAKCDAIKGNIIIGLFLLQEAADHVSPEEEATWDREKLLRCILYHEIGHLLLTPPLLKGKVTVRDKSGRATRNSRDIVNIFEDERIETVLSCFFLGVDFKGFVSIFNRPGAKPKKSGRSRKGAVEKFYDAVRLRDASPDILDAVDSAIVKLATVTAFGRFDSYEYSELLTDLYNRIVSDDKSKSSGGGGDESGDARDGDSGDSESKGGGKSEPKPSDGSESKQDDGKSDGGKDDSEQSDESSEPSDGEDGDKSGEPSGGEDESKSDTSDGDVGDCGDDDGDSGSSYDGKPPDGESDGDDDAEGGGGKPSSGDAGGECDSEGATPSDASGEPDDKDGGDDGLVKPGRKMPELPDDLLEKLADKMFVTPPPDVAKTLERFATRLSKKKGTQAACRWSGLHGKIDTRRDAMDKERIFRRPSDVGESLMTAINLVLWIDISGSFSASTAVLNQILAATATAMGMTGGKLDVKVVKIGDTASVARTDDWKIQCTQCNSVNMTYHKAWMETRDKTRRNIDIVVLDGDAKSDEYIKSETMPDGRPIEKVIWDNPDCHIVCDECNRRYFGAFTRAHVTYLESGYASSLKDEVMKTLDRIL